MTWRRTVRRMRGTLGKSALSRATGLLRALMVAVPLPRGRRIQVKDYIEGGRPAKELKRQVSEDEVVKKKKQASAEKNCAGAEAVVGEYRSD